MDIRKLQRAIVDGLEDVKAHDIAVFNTEHLSPLFERVIIASGTSNRQTKALASSVRDAVKAGGFHVLRTEGEENGEWIIVDCGAAVVHVMQPSIREYYHLEEIWGDKPVRMKLDGGRKSTAGPADEDGEPAPAARSPRRAAAKAPADAAGKSPGTPATKAAAKTAAKPAAKAARSPAKAPAKTSAKAPAKTAAKAPAKKATRASGAAPGAARRGSRTAEPVTRLVVNAPARKAAARTGAKSAAGSTTARTGPRKTAAAKAPARKAAGAAARPGVTRTTGVKRAAPAARKTARKPSGGA